MSSGRLASNAGYLVLLTASNYLLGLLIFPYLSRVLTLETFGLFGFSMAFVVLFQMIVEYGFAISATAKIASRRERPTEIADLLWATMLAKLLLMGVASIVFVGVALAVPTVRDHLWFVSAFVCSAFFAALLPDFYFRGLERMRTIAVRAVITKVASLVMIVLIVRSDEQAIWGPISLAIGNLVAVTLSFFVIFRDGIRFSRPTAKTAWHELKNGVGFFASRIAASVNQAAAALVLGLSFSPASTTMGLFTGASRLATAGEMAVQPLSDALYPYMVRTRDFRLFWRIYLTGLAAWFSVCTVIYVCAEQICAIVLGETYRDAGPLLRILVVGTFMAYSSVFFGYPALTPLGLARHANIGVVVSAFVTGASFYALVLGDWVSAESVCCVVILGNSVSFLYRFIAFLVHSRSSTPTTL